ncbi:UDP-3-O-(3-hydroxymyristoyl)glucosamine N-acyltransferase [Martelella alba]|uniref:UDP-3-O-acylglucosamine N-acyltransferase n=1 Tax=Martelella alba TaxID=2590451 RepID=A0A506UI76_9HYPH|nr:UDP-3-O-(3-hydroxymyristoyl)glucosamine N-acyltransferase [Martelella alba]TPW33031.1 UDP-3-O-(3-hydroxymyristoyl)glucosamine N-acyltransferase [Martelella alba]
MENTKFFGTRKAVRLGELAERVGAELADQSAAERLVESVAPIYRAGAYDVCYIQSRGALAELASCHAGGIFCPPELQAAIPSAIPALVSKNPQFAFARAAALLYPSALRPQMAVESDERISPFASIDPTAVLEESVEVGPYAVIGARAQIGRGSSIQSGAVIGADVKIGRNTTVSANATVFYALIGNDVILHPGVRIGQDGFGYSGSPTGLFKIVQTGRVIIQDRVEIGANTTIDRGAMDDTVIGEGSKIDNLVQIGHNVRIGRHCGVVSQVGIAGSTEIGDGVMIGGQVGINGHIRIGNGVQIAAKSGVFTDVEAGRRIGGIPAISIREHLRHIAETMARSARRESKRGEK